MATKKTDHCIIRNNKLFCSHCGRYQSIPFPVDLDMFGAMTKQFSKTHRTCKKVWEEPVPPEGMNMQQGMMWWLDNGEHGISSKTIFCVAGGGTIMNPKEYSHPHDPSDFYRCYKLLKAAPQLKLHFDKLRNLSNTWNSLVDNWDKLMALIEEQIMTNKDNGMYDLMKNLGC